MLAVKVGVGSVAGVYAVSGVLGATSVITDCSVIFSIHLRGVRCMST